jgi:hypothetical protein
MSELCNPCNERPAVTDRLGWHAAALYFLLGNIGRPGPYCEDCAGGRNFLALLFLIGVALVAFVLAVIFW